MQCLQTATEGIEVLLRARMGADLANVRMNERSQVQNSLISSVLDGGPATEGRWETERGRLSLLYIIGLHLYSISGIKHPGSASRLISGCQGEVESERGVVAC